ncbi:MAG: hypothetical protein IT373_22175 [Polyangiaceae bacterium]|nr:hypothetical protein [Polyangiaceae bacterium]
MSDEDLHRWERTESGPDKLAAVLLHDKYEMRLRVEAAMSLIRMKPRKGRQVGLEVLIENVLSSPSLPPETRNTIVAELVPLVIEQLKVPPPTTQAGQAAPPDESFKFKDAAYRLLTFERTALVADAGLKDEMKQALTRWAMADFERRLNDRSQAYGMEQLLRYIGSDSVVDLPGLMSKDTKALQLKKMADIVAKIGSKATREEAGKKLVEIAQYIAADAWRSDPQIVEKVKADNERGGYEVNEKQFGVQLAMFQEETLIGVLGSMKQVGGSAVVDFCLQLASDSKPPEKWRQVALDALQQNLDKDNPKHAERLLAIAASDAPGIVLDQAFARLREFKRSAMIDKLYELFKTDKWKVRRSAAVSALQVSKAGDLDEFMQKLATAEKNFALDEPIKYGAYLGDLKTDDATPAKWGGPRQAIEAYLTKGSVQARLTALGYLYSYGTQADLPKIQALFADKEKIPKCDEAAACEWTCAVPKKDDPKQSEDKAITTLGEFAELCVAPKMVQNRQPEAEEKGKDKKAPAPPAPTPSASAAPAPSASASAAPP